MGTQLTEDSSEATYQIQAYEPDKATVNDQILQSSFIIAPETLITHWPVTSLATLELPHWEPLLTLAPHIILLGVGDTMAFPPQQLLAPLYEKGIGIEIMTNSAACRTYNVLVSEGRYVAAGIILS